MAMDLQQTNARALLIAPQPTAGTPVTLLPATHGMLVSKGSYRYSADELTRDIDKSGHGAMPFVNIKRRAQFSGGIELRGAATVGAASPIGRILRACGFAETLTPATSAIYSLVTSGFEMFSLGGYEAGTLVSGMDGRGALTKIELSIRNFAKAEFDLLALGQAVPVSDAAVASPDLSAFQAPVAIETETFEVDIGGTKLNAISLSVDTNAQVDIYEGSEGLFVYLKEFYKPSGTLRVFKEQRSVFHPENVALANTLQNIYGEVVGGGETLRLDLNSVQLGLAKSSEQDGLAAWDIPFKVVGSNATNCMALSFLTV